jgi:phosphonate transport system substrate-binding protein
MNRSRLGSVGSGLRSEANSRDNRGVSRALRIATFLAPSVRPVYEAVVARLRRDLGLSVELVVGDSFEQFAAGDLDGGFICGLPYVQLARRQPSPVEPLAAPLLRGERYQGRPIYFSDVIVHRKSRFLRFGDLRGASWAFNDTDSHSGFNLTRYRLVQIEETTLYFGRVVAAGFHQRAIEMVARGEVDGAAIDSQVLGIALRDDPALEDALRVIEMFGPSTIQPFVVASHIPVAVKTAMRVAVLAVGGDPGERAALRHGLVERFVPVGDSDYDDIRAMLAAVEAANVRSLR